MWPLIVAAEEHICFCTSLRQSEASELHRDVELFRHILLVFIKNSLRVKAEVIKAEMVVCKICSFIINL